MGKVSVSGNKVAISDINNDSVTISNPVNGFRWIRFNAVKITYYVLPEFSGSFNKVNDVSTVTADSIGKIDPDTAKNWLIYYINTIKAADPDPNGFRDFFFKYKGKYYYECVSSSGFNSDYFRSSDFKWGIADTEASAFEDMQSWDDDGDRIFIWDNTPVQSVTKVTLTDENTTVTMANNSARVISVVADEKTLTTADYTVKYKNSDGINTTRPTKPGNYTAIIKGNGNYKGSVEKKFTIAVNTTEMSETIDVTSGETRTTQTYNGRKCSVMGYNHDGDGIAVSSDYYGENRVLTVNAAQGYKITKVEYTIDWLNPALTLDKLKISDGILSSENFANYGVIFADILDGDVNELVLSDTKVPMVNIRSVKVYYENTQPITLTDENTTVTMAENSAKVESVVVGEATLTADEYTVSYKNADGTDLSSAPTKGGSYIAVITGKWDYVGSVTKPFTFVSYEKTDAKTATYTEDGNIEYYTGSDGKLYTDDQGTLLTDRNNDNKVDPDDTIVSALGHSWNAPTFERTETANGYTATATCTCKTEKSHTETVDATVTASVTTNPTCTEKGVKTYTAKVTIDGVEYTEDKSVDIAALGHDWNSPTFEWTETANGYTATATCTCKTEKSHTETVDATVTASVTTNPTCTEKGVKTYTAKVTIDGVEYTEDKQVDADPIGHEWSAPTYTWSWVKATGEWKCTAKRTCSNDETHIETETATVTSKITTPAEPTYVADGKTVYLATVKFGDKTYTNTRTVAIDKLTYTAPTVTFEKGENAVKLNWTKIKGAESYAVVAYVNGSWEKLAEGNTDTYTIKNLTAGKWKLLAQTTAKETTFTKTKVPAGSYKVVVGAKINGEWDICNLNQRAVTVTIK
ncbi:hypothetical protein SAMN02910446_01955 [Ruminococcus sp. YE78]|nr:hypothetical protein SAMN02910446_01955 [Ruminococcus sp. YE78]